MQKILGGLILIFCLIQIGYGKGVDPQTKMITISISSEPPSLDSSIAEDGISRNILAMTNEGLVTYNQRLQAVPAIAQRWEEQGLTITYFLRPEAIWRDGTSVTAHDFVYAWRRLVDPATGASGSTTLAWIIEGATEILKGELAPEKLGVVAIDDHTLQVTKSGPVTFFNEIIGTAPFYPLKRAFVEAQKDRYATEVGKILENGPFLLSDWVHGASLKLIKNENYWGTKDTQLNGINIGYVTSDARTLLNLFNSQELAMFNVDDTTVKEAAATGIRLRQQRETGCIALVTFNLREGRPTSNKAIRKAVQAVFEPQVFVDRIIAVPANRPAYSMFPSHLYALNQPFHREYPHAGPVNNRDAALRWMKKASKQLGDLPALVLLASEGQEKQVEYLQGLLQEHLGIEVRIDKQTFKQAITKLIAGNFDLALSRFCGAQRDPDFFASIFESSNTFNDGRFKDTEYDQLMALTRGTSDQHQRMNAFGRMQEILHEEAVVLPTHEVGFVYAQDKQLVKVQRFPALRFSRSDIR